MRNNLARPPAGGVAYVGGLGSRSFYARAFSFLSFLLFLVRPSLADELRYKDTAGTYLRQVVEQVRSRYEDADLISVTGRGDKTGSAVCMQQDPSTDGWHYHFYSRKYDQFVFMAQCQGYVVGPMKSLLTTGRDSKPILGKFIDNDEALASLAAAGVSIEPSHYKVPPRRPFTFTLVSVEDDRHQENPLFWQIKIGAGVFYVNSITRKVESDVYIRYQRTADGHILKPGNMPEGGAGATGIFKIPARAKKKKGYTAFRDLENVRNYVKKKMPGAALMGVDGIADAWGHLECDGPGDGWAYYVYWPRTKKIEVVYACRGAVHEGASGYIPVSVQTHQELPRQAIGVDSDRAMDGLLADKVSVMNEGMGRYYSRRVPMRIFKYKASPFTAPALWSKTLVWEVSVGRSTYLLDAENGKFLAEKPNK